LNLRSSAWDAKLQLLKKLALTACCLVPSLSVGIDLWEEMAIAKEVNSKNECVRCHTNVKGLIRLGWEVEKVKPKQGKSTKTSGEG
jgi:hypothetical protein